MPIIIFTAHDHERAKLNAFDLGADDYVIKPFSARELIARIRAAVRRVSPPATPEEMPIEIGGICLNPAMRLVTKRNKPLRLTLKEFALLHCLMLHPDQVMTYAKLLSNVWADNRNNRDVECLRTFMV
jgi:two-component system phosphate regulon response regulator PhoB